MTSSTVPVRLVVVPPHLLVTGQNDLDMNRGANANRFSAQLLRGVRERRVSVQTTVLRLNRASKQDQFDFQHPDNQSVNRSLHQALVGRFRNLTDLVNRSILIHYIQFLFIEKMNCTPVPFHMAEQWKVIKDICNAGKKWETEEDRHRLIERYFLLINLSKIEELKCDDEKTNLKNEKILKQLVSQHKSPRNNARDLVAILQQEKVTRFHRDPVRFVRDVILDSYFQNGRIPLIRFIFTACFSLEGEMTSDHEILFYRGFQLIIQLVEKHRQLIESPQSKRIIVEMVQLGMNQFGSADARSKTSFHEDFRSQYLDCSLLASIRSHISA